MSHDGSYIWEPVVVWAAQVRELLARFPQAFVAGGAARQVIMREEAPPAEDVDLFLYDGQQLGLVASDLHRLQYRVAGETDYSMTFERNRVFDLPVQLIKPLSDRYTLTAGDPDEVLEHFSFTTEQFALAHHGAEIQAMVARDAREHTRRRELHVHNITDPLMVALRACKYAGKGYHMPQQEMARILDAHLARTVAEVVNG